MDRNRAGILYEQFLFALDDTRFFYFQNDVYLWNKEIFFFVQKFLNIFP